MIKIKIIIIIKKKIVVDIIDGLLKKFIFILSLIINYIFFFF
jgi:hypothetical protein